MLFSIIIPVYGVEEYLPQTIESVLNQSVNDWELILVDDGSLDNSGAICDRYAAKDARIRVIHKQNGGLVSARQAGVAQAHGEYILNLDGDDYWESGLLTDLATVVDQYHPDCILFGFQMVTEEGVPLRARRNKPEEGLYTGASLEEIWKEMLYSHQSSNMDKNTGNFCNSIVGAAIRTEIVTPLQQAVPRQIRIGEDAAVTIPAVCNCSSVYFLDNIDYNYRQRNTSMMKTFSPKTMEETALLAAHLKKYAKQLPQKNLYGYWYRMLDQYCVDAARSLPDYGQFKSCVSSALTTLPRDVLRYFSTFQMQLKYRLRLFAIKHHLWILFWLFYHRR